MIKVIGLGAGGHAKVIVEALKLGKKYQVVGLLDADAALKGRRVLSVPVLGSDELLPKLYKQGIRHVFVGLGSVLSTEPHKKLFEKAKAHRFKVLTAIHPYSYVSPSAVIGEGSVVFAHAVIQTQAVIGKNVIVNSGAIIEHDCVIEDHAHVSVGAMLGGAVHVGSGAHIGLGACVLQGIKIGKNSVVGAGSVVLKNVPANKIVAGVPAETL